MCILFHKHPSFKLEHSYEIIPACRFGSYLLQTIFSDIFYSKEQYRIEEDGWKIGPLTNVDFLIRKEFKKFQKNLEGRLYYLHNLASRVCEVKLFIRNFTISLKG